ERWAGFRGDAPDGLDPGTNSGMPHCPDDGDPDRAARGRRSSVRNPVRPRGRFGQRRVSNVYYEPQLQLAARSAPPNRGFRPSCVERKWNWVTSAPRYCPALAVLTIRRG